LRFSFGFYDIQHKALKSAYNSEVKIETFLSTVFG